VEPVREGEQERRFFLSVQKWDVHVRKAYPGHFSGTTIIGLKPTGSFLIIRFGDIRDWIQTCPCEDMVIYEKNSVVAKMHAEKI